jgi:3-oxoacyl-[acyl-carrier-protein] synthase-1
MSRAAGLSVFGHAMLTAVGADGPATCAAMRAGINGARRAKLWDFTVGEDLNAARPRLHQWGRP